MVLHNRIGLDYLQAEQAGVYAMVIPGSITLVLWQIQKINKHSTWINQVDVLRLGTFLDLFDNKLVWFIGVKECNSVPWFYLPDNHHCSLPGGLCSPEGLKYAFVAISDTSDGLTVLRETEANEKQEDNSSFIDLTL